MAFDENIKYKKKQDPSTKIDKILHPIILKWFKSKFKDYAPPQKYAVAEIHNRNNILVSAPTGSGKTLTAFLSILNELFDLSQKDLLTDEIYAVYISPLKALSKDIQYNLLNPLNELEELSKKPSGIRVMARTGDTTQKEKNAMLKNSPHILITTPESLSILLTSKKFSEKFKNLQYVIIDEIHSLAENKRGTHLSLSLEMLEQISNGFTRIGLSATVAPLDEIAKYLVGYKEGTSRNCLIVDVNYVKKKDIQVISPVDDMINVDFETIQAKLYVLLDDMIQKHKTTIIFTNTRSATERVVDKLKTKFPSSYHDSNIGAHHGSLSKDVREQVEQNLRDGKMKCVVTSTSLELGIDIGSVDLVLLLGSPKSVARALQRIGRSGHSLNAIAKGFIIVMDRDDLVECSVLLKEAIEHKIDRIIIPTNALDVLAQMIFAFVITRQYGFKELFAVVTRAYPYHDLNYNDYINVLDYLAGNYADLETRYVYAKIFFNRDEGTINARGKLSRMLYMTNLGTIPEEARITVKVNGHIIGYLDEMFTEQMKPGDVFVLGGQTYLFRYMRNTVANVAVSIGRPPTIPSWASETLPLSFDLARAIAHFRSLMKDRFKANDSKTDILAFIKEYLYVDDNAAIALYSYFKEQFEFSIIPEDKTLLIEHYKSYAVGGVNDKRYYNYQEDEKVYHVFHTMVGRRINNALSRSFAFAISKIGYCSVEIGVNDNAFYLSYKPKKQFNLKTLVENFDEDKFRTVLLESIKSTEIYRMRFRHCATRAMMILRSYKGQKKRIGRQYFNSKLLLNTVQGLDKDFPVLKETEREIMHDSMDIENAVKFIVEVNSKRIKIKEYDTKLPSPFSFNIVMEGLSDILKANSKYEFLQQMHKMILAKIALSEGKKNK